MRMIFRFSYLLLCMVLVSCTLSTSTKTQTITLTATTILPTHTIKPTSTIIPPTQTAIPTVTPIATQTITPTLMDEEKMMQPELGGMQVPWSDVAITSDNASQITELVHWERGPIRGIAWSPDGKILAIGSSTEIRLYDAEKYEEISTIARGLDINNYTYSPNGEMIAVASSSGIHLYDAETYEEVSTIAKGSEIDNIIYSPDGAVLVGGDGDKITMWDVTSGKVLLTFASQGSMAFSPNGKFLAVEYDVSAIWIWDMFSEKVTYTIAKETKSLSYGQLIVSSDGEMLISLLFPVTYSPSGYLERSNDPGVVKVWDVGSGTRLRSLANCTGENMTLSSNNHTVAVRQDDAILFCDVETGSIINKLKVKADYHMAYSPDGAILAAGVNNSIKLWDAITLAEVNILLQEEGVGLIVFSPDGKRIAAISLNSVKIWDITSGQELHTLTGYTPISYGELLVLLEGYEYGVTGVTFSPDGQILAIIGGEGPVKLFKVKTGELLAELETQVGFVHRVAFSPDGKLIAVCGWSYLSLVSGVQIWDVATRELRLKLDGFSSSVQSVAFSPDGMMLATGEGSGYGYGGAAKLWNIATGEMLQEFGYNPWWEPPDYNSVFDIAFSPDGSVLATANAGGSVLLWDVAKQVQVTVLTGTAGSVMRISFSPDGRLLAAVGKSKGYDTNDLRLWDLTTGETLFILEGQGAFNPDPMISEGYTGGKSVAFNPDGKILASTSADGSVRLWDVRTAEALTTLSGDFSTVAFSPDGTLLATVGDTVRLWGIPP